jgi:GNAT superfamily N-acetyltransferase
MMASRSLPSGVQIVVAQAGDADVVFEMAAVLTLDGPLDRAAFNVQFDEVLRSERSVALLAIYESTVVGYAVGALVPMPIYSGGAAFLQELYVDGSQRRNGVGTALVDAFTEWAAGLGATRVVLATSRAGPFYESIGFLTRAQYYVRAVNPSSGRSY